MKSCASSATAYCILLAWAIAVIPCESSSLRLVRMTSDVRREKPQLTMTIEYQAAEEPQVVWFTDSPASPFPANSTFAGGRGASVLTLAEARVGVTLAIGQLKGQYFEMYPVTMEGRMTQDLNVQQKLVQPGSDLAYKKGAPAVVTTTMATSRGKQYFNYSPYGSWLDSSGKLVGAEHPRIPFLTMDPKNLDQSLTVKMTFNTDKTINGYFVTADYVQFPEYPSIVSVIFDKVVLKVHENTITGPFPDSFLSLQMKNNDGEDISAFGCIPGYTERYMCVLKCEAEGNNVKSVRLYKAQSSSSGDPIKKWKVKQTMPFALQAEAQLDMSKDFAGDYTCEAKMTNGVTKVQTVKVTRLDRAASIKGLTRRFLNKTDFELECKATGDGPLEVLFTWASTYGIPIEADGYQVLNITSSASADRSIVSTKMIMRLPVQEDTVFCVAKNIASSDDRYYHVRA